MSSGIRRQESPGAPEAPPGLPKSPQASPGVPTAFPGVLTSPASPGVPRTSYAPLASARFPWRPQASQAFSGGPVPRCLQASGVKDPQAPSRLPQESSSIHRRPDSVESSHPQTTPGVRRRQQDPSGVPDYAILCFPQASSVPRLPQDVPTPPLASAGSPWRPQAPQAFSGGPVPRCLQA
jgi:hypothetical protein